MTPTVIVGTSQIAGRITVDGVPIPGVVVYGGTLGAATTDEDGIFRFVNVPPDAGVVTLQPSLLGYTFPAEQYEASPGDFVPIAGGLGELDNTGCAAEGQSEGLVAIQLAGKLLHDRGLINVAYYRNFSEKNLTGAVRANNIRESKGIGRRLRRGFLQLQQEGQDYPEIILSCEGRQDCPELRLGHNKRKLNNIVSHMRRTVMFAARRSRQFRPGSTAWFIEQNRAKRFHRSARREINKLPLTHSNCPS